MKKKFDSPEQIRELQRKKARTTVIAGAALLLLGLCFCFGSIMGYILMIAGFIMVDMPLQNYGKGLFRNNIPPADKPWWKK